MEPTTFLERLQADKSYRNQLVHVEHLRPRAPRYGKLARALHPSLAKALKAKGFDKFYTHQANAIDLARAGHDVIVATGTASGKTLCYNVPVLDAVLNDPRARA